MVGKLIPSCKAASRSWSSASLLLLLLFFRLDRLFPRIGTKSYSRRRLPSIRVADAGRLVTTCPVMIIFAYVLTLELYSIYTFEFSGQIVPGGSDAYRCSVFRRPRPLSFFSDVRRPEGSEPFRDSRPLRERPRVRHHRLHSDLARHHRVRCVRCRRRLRQPRFTGKWL